MTDLNIVVVQGNVVQEPKIIEQPSGLKIAFFSIALNRSYKVGEEKKESVCYVDIVAMNKPAEIVQANIKKGKKVTVKGRLEMTPEKKLRVFSEELYFEPIKNKVETTEV